MAFCEMGSITEDEAVTIIYEEISPLTSRLHCASPDVKRSTENVVKF